MNLNIIPVPFHGVTQYLIEHNGEPYVVMKPIVEGIGLTWSPQLRKLNNQVNRWGVIKMIIPLMTNGQDMVCMPLKKIFGWLCTISPEKVGPEIRGNIEVYLATCDDVLWSHWTGQGPIQEAHAPQDVKMFVSCMRESTYGNPLAIAYLEKHHGLVMPEDTQWQPLQRRRKKSRDRLQEAMNEMARNAPAFFIASLPEPEPEAPVSENQQEADEEYAAWLKQQAGPRGE